MAGAAGKDGMQRFSMSSLTPSRLVFSTEWSETMTAHNAQCMSLLVSEFHRPSSPVQPPVQTSVDAVPPSTQAPEIAKLAVLKQAAQQRDPGTGRLYSQSFVVVFVITKNDFSERFDLRRMQLSNMAASGFCKVAAIVAPDIAHNVAVVEKLRLPGVAVIDARELLPPRGEGDDDVASLQAAAAACGPDETAGLYCTPRQWFNVVSGKLWQFVSQSRIASGTLTVHAWGASLTEGYTWDGGKPNVAETNLIFQPYSDHLMTTVLPREKEDLPAVAIPVNNFGVSGETAAEVRTRFESELQRKDSSHRPGDIIVILAGTNDLCQGRPWKEVFNDIVAMVQLAKQRGLCAIVCSLPSTADAADDELYAGRGSYNGALRVLGSREADEFVDVFDLTAERTTGEVRALRADLAVDNLHLTPEGYKILAEEIGVAIRKILMRRYAPSPPAADDADNDVEEL